VAVPSISEELVLAYLSLGVTRPIVIWRDFLKTDLDKNWKFIFLHQIARYQIFFYLKSTAINLLRQIDSCQIFTSVRRLSNFYVRWSDPPLSHFTSDLTITIFLRHIAHYQIFTSDLPLSNFTSHPPLSNFYVRSPVIKFLRQIRHGITFLRQIHSYQFLRQIARFHIFTSDPLLSNFYVTAKLSQRHHIFTSDPPLSFFTVYLRLDYRWASTV